ncbi:MAG: DUF3365 domain-containing protein [Campylobacterota bacterium]|nr:DUF3365 domain-containing protein [Campylobacterota bacterium]
MLKTLLNKIKVIFVLIYIFVSVVLYYVLSSYSYESAEKKIKDNLIMAAAIQKYITDHQKPAVNKLIAQNRLDKDFFDVSLMSSTYIVANVQENFKNDNHHIYSELDFKFASDNPTNPKNKATAFESEVLKKFNASEMSLYKEKVKHNGQDKLFYAFGVERNTDKCLQCHGVPSDAPKDMTDVYGNKNGFHEKLGEIRAINAVYAPIDSDGTMWKFYIILNLLALFIFTSIYFTLRYFFVQLVEKDELIAKQSRFAALGEMISMIAHQWRQPLTGMGMSINNLLLDIELGEVDEKKLETKLEQINTQIRYLSSTIDDFKNFFKPNLKKEEVKLKKLIDDTLLIIDSSIKSNGVAIDVDIDENLMLTTMKNDITQIVLNLVKNSMDAYKENKIEEKKIEVIATSTAKTVSIIVKDYAGGIPKDVVEKIFDPYFSTKDEKNGTGLGLYMSKMIVEDHLAGSLVVDVIDDTSSFTITLNKVGI